MQAIAVSLLFAADTPTSAFFVRDWLDPTGGLFSDGTNWSGGVPPGLSDQAIFNLNSTYTVSFGLDVENNFFQIQHGHVTFDLNGASYTALINIATHANEDGELTVRDGTLVHDSVQFDAMIGQPYPSVGASGKLTVTTGGIVNVNPQVQTVVGGNGSTGTLVIQSGGDMTGGTAVIGYGTGGTGDGATGFATVTGTGSTWSLTTLRVGFNNSPAGVGGVGTLSIQSAGEVSVSGDALIGAAGNSNGSLTLTGTGSHFDVGGNLYVGGGGGAPGTGVLNINGRTTVDVNSLLQVLGPGTLNFAGGSLSVGSLQRLAGGDIIFTAGALSITASSLTISPSGPFGAAFNMNANMSVSAVGATINAGASLNMSGGSFGTTFFSSGLTNNGTIDISNAAAEVHGRVTNNELIHGTGMFTGRLTNAAGGEVRATGAEHLTFTFAGDFLTPNNTFNSGTLNLVGGGTIEFSGIVTNNAGGIIMGSGTLFVDSLTNSGLMSFTGASNVFGEVGNAASGTIAVLGGSTTFFNDVTHNGTSIQVSTGSSAIYKTLLTGAAPFTGGGTNVIQGILRPGNSAADVSFGGDVSLLATATLELELGGLNAGSDYDRLTVAGDVTLDGIADVNLINNFDPALGDTFDVIVAGSHHRQWLRL
jgi:T5SS/PEP-CTERM-associated repeat protein